MSGLISKKGFWGKIDKPIYALAPMADVTDTTFRQIVASRGKPDLFMTEFVSVDGLCSKGRDHLLRDLRYDEVERPIVAQLFGAKPDNFAEAASLVRELGFDGIDINMGCPVKVICKNGAGSTLIRKPEIAREIIQETISGAGGLPVSVKTRIGYSTIEIDKWIPVLLESGIVAMIVHLRTKKEMSKAPAHWEVMPEVVKLAKGSGVLILGNGDVQTPKQADQLTLETGIDGVMFGRAIFGNPWLFDTRRELFERSVEERIQVMLEHTQLFDKTFSGEKKFMVIRKHLMAYCSGFRGAKEFRISLEKVNSYFDVNQAVEQFRMINIGKDNLNPDEDNSIVASDS